MSATDPARLREGIEKAKKATGLPWSWERDDAGPLVDADLSEANIDYAVHAANYFPALAREIEKLRHLLRESLGWMQGVEPKPAPPFLDAIRTALAAGATTETRPE